jgi:hypothetical protein
MWRLNHNVNEQNSKNMAKIIIKNHLYESKPKIFRGREREQERP